MERREFLKLLGLAGLAIAATNPDFVFKSKALILKEDDYSLSFFYKINSHIDQVRAFNKPLSSNEILSILNEKVTYGKTTKQLSDDKGMNCIVISQHNGFIKTYVNGIEATLNEMEIELVAKIKSLYLKDYIKA